MPWKLLFLLHPGAVQQLGLCDTLSTVLSPPAPLASHGLSVVGFVVATDRRGL